MQDVFNFSRRVTAYEIRTARPTSGQPGAGKKARYLCERGGTAREYNPLADPAVFLRFSDAHPLEENAIVDLANQYGFLFAHQLSLVGQLPAGELVESWRKETEHLHAAVELWEASRHRLLAWITEGVGKRENDYIYKGPLGDYLISSPPSLINAAMHVLQRSVDYKLKSACEVRFLWNVERSNGLVYDHPKSLQACLWLQLAYAVAGKSPEDYRRCGECTRRFEIADTMRRDSKFCSNACRVRAYRHRKKEAQRLGDKGVPFREIARRLGSDAKTVKGWVIK